MVVQQVDRVVDREPEERRSERERDAVELAVDEKSDGRGAEKPEDAGQERQQQALAGAEREQQDGAHAGEGDSRDPGGIPPCPRLAGYDVAVEPAALELEGAAVGGVDALEGCLQVGEERPLHPRIEARSPRREEEDGVAPVARDELAVGDPEGVLRPGQALEHAAEAAERVGGHDLREERRDRERELAPEVPGLVAQPLLG